MSIVKTAEAHFTLEEIQDSDVALANSVVRDRFFEKVAQLKKIAPKAKDFLYFSCIMLHADSAALINQETGEPILGKDGKPITAKWDIHPKTGSWKWVCSDPNIKPYKNNNGDIFPESELKKAYRNWVEKPLCQDHQSTTVDGMRGLIIDTFWDDKRKRVIGLCALDRKNYPELARKVESKYATNVSMGTAVGKSICFDCGNVARTESEYCNCVRQKRAYGEVNIDLSPIELSIVVIGADPKAKLRHIIASLNGYAQQKQARIEELQRAGCVTPDELSNLRSEVEAMRKQLDEVSKLRSLAALDPSQGAIFRTLVELINNPAVSAEVKNKANEQLLELLGGSVSPSQLVGMETPEAKAEDGVSCEGHEVEEAEDNPEGEQEAEDVEPPYGLAGNKAMTGGKGRSYTEDPESSGPPPWSFDGRETRLANVNLDKQILAVQARLDTIQSSLQDLAANIQATTNRTNPKEENNMSNLRERARARREAFAKNAYYQGGGGVNEPQTYPVDPTNDKVKKTEDKQMVGEGMEMGNTGLADGDLELKKKLLRAELEERRIRRHALLSNAEETQTVTVGNEKLTLKKGPDGKWAVAQAQPVEDEEGLETLAYYQGGGGVNEPQTYPVDPLNDKVKKTEDKQMVGVGMEMGNTGLADGDLELKKKLLRADLSAKFIKVYADQAKSAVDRKRSRWEVYAGDQKLFSATGEQIYDVSDLSDDNYWTHLSSADYGRRILAEIRSNGLDKTAYLLTGKVVTAAEPELPPPGAPPAPMAPPAEAPKAEEKPGAESTKNRVDEALAEVEKALGDLKEVLKEEGKSGEEGKEELPPIEIGGEVEKAASVCAAIDNVGDELAVLSEVLGKRIEAGMTTGTEMSELLKLAQESLDVSTELCKEASFIIEAKKGKMPEGLKKALEEKEKGKKGKKEKDEEEDEVEEKEDKKEKKEKGKKESKKEKKEKDEEEDEVEEKEEKKGKKGKKSEAELVLEKMLKVRAAKRRELVRLAIDEEKEEKFEEEEHEIHEEMEDLIQELENIDKEEAESDDVQYGEDGGEEDPLVAELLEELEKEDEGKKEEVFEEEPAADMSSLASRRAWREKVAAEVGSKYQLKLEPAADMETDMVPAAHTEGGHKLEGLDTKPSDEGSRFERIDEVKSMIMKQVESLPPVREAVAKVGDLLKSGKLSVEDLSDVAKLKALAVDPAAANYWKAFYGEGDPGSKQFGQELVKDFVQKKASADAETYRLKLRRAVDLALDMQDKGLISQGRDAMNRQVDDIMKFDDQAFEAFKRALSRTTNVSKTAGKSEPAIQVGIRDEVVEPSNLTDQLNRLWVPKK